MSGYLAKAKCCGLKNLSSLFVVVQYRPPGFNNESSSNKFLSSTNKRPIPNQFVKSGNHLVLNHKIIIRGANFEGRK